MTWRSRRLPGSRSSGRFFWLLLAAWIVNLFDLGFTLIAQQQRLMIELNPVAVHILRKGPAFIITYKLVLLVLGSSVLWWYRHRRFTEGCLWFYCVACLLLALRWHTLYRTAEPLWVEANTINELLPENRYFAVYSLSRPKEMDLEAHTVVDLSKK